MTILPSLLASPLEMGVWLVFYCAPSTEHILIVRGLRAKETNQATIPPLPRLTLPEPLCYSLAHMKTHSPLSTPA